MAYGGLIPWRRTEIAPLWRREFTPFFREFETVFDRMLGEMARIAPVGLAVPPMELREKDKEYVVRLEVPGLSEKDFDISCADNTLTVRGEKKEEDEGAGEGISWSERSYGAFERSITLPAGARTDEITATYRAGILEIHVPKREEARARRIEVKAAEGEERALPKQATEGAQGQGKGQQGKEQRRQ